ncbi:hypothetical protein [Rhizobium sp.]
MSRQNVIPIAEPTISPVAVGNGFGLMHRGAMVGDCGVVLCSPWGIDELAARKVLFRLASRLAASGVPAIRFDYPGTADAIDIAPEGFDSWVQSASQAADSLKASCGLNTVIFAGIGLGAMVAVLASVAREDVAGLVLAAPVIGGRRYLREIALGAPVVEEGLGLNASQRPEGVTIGGIVMPDGVAATLKSIDLMKADAGSAKRLLMVHRPAQPQEAALADHLDAQGWDVERAAFEGYDAAMSNPTIAVMPEQVIETITQWATKVGPSSGLTVSSPEPARPLLTTTSYGADETICFGPNLFGVLTHPASPSTATTVVFLNSGYDHHAGWAYQWARAARSLAASGIASLRFDMANIGDSAARPGVPEQVLYGDGQVADIVSAIDMLAARGAGPILLAGRCSGAFVAFQASARDARIAGAVVINPFRLVWDPDEDVETVIRIGPRSMAEYRKRALSGKILSRLMAGDIDVWGVAKGLASQLSRRVIQTLGPLAGSLSKTGRLRRHCHQMFAAISGRGAPVHMVFSHGDAGLEQLAAHFGADFRLLKLFPGASLTIVPDADHNMTPQPAQDAVVEVIRDAARQLSPAARMPADAAMVQGVVPKMAG